MDRPGLQRLLTDIAGGRVDTVVIYKIDRLTRSDITQAILDGRQPRGLTADKLLAHSRLPLAWHEQRIVRGFA